MFRMIIVYGIIAGLIVGVPMSISTANAHIGGVLGMVVGYLTMLVALSTVFVAIKRRRDRDQGGVIRFWSAFGLGLGISFVASVIYFAAWEATTAYIHLDFGTVYANSVIAQQKAAGVTGEALQKVIDQMEQFKVQYANPLYRLPMTFIEIFPVGVLVSLIS